MNEGMKLDGPINPLPKRKGPDVLFVRFHEIEHDGDLGEAINWCFAAGASRIKVIETDYDGDEAATIKVVTPDAQRFRAALSSTNARGLFRTRRTR